MKFSYHNHSVNSDGHNTIAEMCDAACRFGMDYFAVTDHIHSDETPEWTLNYTDYPRYLAEIAEQKKLYAGRMTVFSGIEADWYRGLGTHYSRYEHLIGKIDLTVGSVHILNPNRINYIIDDGSDIYLACLNEGFSGNVREMVKYYYQSYIEMVESLRPNLAAHIDLLQKNNSQLQIFDEREDYCVQLMHDVAAALSEQNIPTEVNGGGAYRYGNNVYYPSPSFISILREHNVRFTVGLDAHSTDMVSGYYDASLRYLKEHGVKELWYFDGCEWLPSAIE